jgi:hypothetical protein
MHDNATMEQMQMLGMVDATAAQSASHADHVPQTLLKNLTYRATPGEVQSSDTSSTSEQAPSPKVCGGYPQ